VGCIRLKPATDPLPTRQCNASFRTINGNINVLIAGTRCLRGEAPFVKALHQVCRKLDVTTRDYSEPKLVPRVPALRYARVIFRQFQLADRFARCAGNFGKFSLSTPRRGVADADALLEFRLPPVFQIPLALIELTRKCTRVLDASSIKKK
jgi:hypothetical protein